MEDSQIVALFLQRKERAIEETAAKYGKYCYSIAYHILENQEDAEEAVSDTYIGLWNAIPPHQPLVLSTFAGKITRQIALKQWKRNRAQKRGGGEVTLALEELSECIPAGGTVERNMEAAALRQSLNRFVQALPPAEKKVFVCRYWYLDSIDEIGQRFGFSQSKVKSMLSRTRKKLLTHLKKEGIDL